MGTSTAGHNKAYRRSGGGEVRYIEKKEMTKDHRVPYRVSLICPRGRHESTPTLLVSDSTITKWNYYL